jgi:regulator of RNase E activity RraA/CMP-N-acetylneuraminic acid synthetase
MDSKYVVAVVPCKGESRRVPNKNVQFVGGMPLWLRKAEQLKRIATVDEVWIDSDDEYILEDARKRGYPCLVRPIGVNEYDGHELFAWEVSQLPKAAVYVQALCTAPFLSDSLVECGIAAVSGGGDTAYCTQRRRDYQVGCYSDAIPNSDTLPHRTVDCMSMYVVDGDYARRTGKRTGGDECHLNCSDSEALDIDYPADLEHAQALAYGLNELEQRRLRALKPLLSSALLSDCLVELGYDDCCLRCKSQTKTDKFFGRACTLKLSTNGERSIYDALEHYEWCMPGDILCIQAHDGCAYFGELNASMALRAGAQSVLIDGLTRDGIDVKGLGLAVRSNGLYPFDCRNDLRVEGIGVDVAMWERTVAHRQLLFWDTDGVVEIPVEAEDAVLEAAMERARNEASIKHDIAAGISATELTANNGNF